MPLFTIEMTTTIVTLFLFTLTCKLDISIFQTTYISLHSSLFFYTSGESETTRLATLLLLARLATRNKFTTENTNPIEATTKKKYVAALPILWLLYAARLSRYPEKGFSASVPWWRPRLKSRKVAVFMTVLAENFMHWLTLVYPAVVCDIWLEQATMRETR